MRHQRAAATVVSGLTLLALAIAPGPATGTTAGATAGAATAPQHSPGTPAATNPGLPDDGPPALYRASPSLPAAKGWPASNDAFPLTSGTGRLEGGAFYWTDYLYDDHGGTTPGTGDPSVTAGSPSFGTYRYPAGGAYAHNAADVFRTAVALRKDATYWRVDWNMLAKRTVPLAVWTFDRDNDPSTGVSAWPGAANVSSPGIDTALLVSSHGARLVDLVKDKTLRVLPTTVTPAAHSFVVKVPRTLLPVSHDWRIRLAAGLANADGTGFEQPPGTTPAQAAVYNVGYRARFQEQPTNNYWNDQAQTKALDSGSVARFGVVVHWSRLARRLTTPQRTPHGWNDRWYVSAVSLGNGVKVAPTTISDGDANYLGRVQPYAVYVPAHAATARLPLTFLLHSLTQNHNQYAATTPKLVQGVCEQRHSICATTLGRGPDGGYHDEAELDFWQVWHAVASTFTLDPDRTVLSGYSMGGIGTNQLAMAHPDLFARAVTLAGGIGDSPSLVNLRWVPTYLAGGTADELVPVPKQRAEADALRALGFRYRWLLVAGMDHVAYELCDCFADAVAYMQGARRVTQPQRFDFLWHPRNGKQAYGNSVEGNALSWTQRPDLGVGTTGDYWVRGLVARSTAIDASVSARSTALPGQAVTPVPSTSTLTTTPPGPTMVTSQTWRLGAATTLGHDVSLTLTNVERLTLLTALAGIPAGGSATLHITTDGPTTLLVGTRTFTLTKGSHTMTITA